MQALAYVVEAEFLLETRGRTGYNIVAEVLEDMDEYIFNSEDRKKEYESVKKDHASLLTSFGMVEYNRRYYKSKESEKHTPGG
jgi:predicted site-specific integrase-resolvase